MYHRLSIPPEPDGSSLSASVTSIACTWSLKDTSRLVNDGDDGKEVEDAETGMTMSVS